VKKSKVFLCVPTFKEPVKAKLFLDCLGKTRYSDFEVVVVNANSGDETSVIISEMKDELPFLLTELPGKKEEFWSATLNRGLRYVLDNATDDDLVMITNIDIEFSMDIVSELADAVAQTGNCQMGALAFSNGVAISSGVSVKSWMFTLNSHPLAGMTKQEIGETAIPVDYLPGRCFMFPAYSLRTVGVIDEKDLPHYHADYEFSYRLKKSGFQPFINPRIAINADMTNTGLSLYDSKTNIAKRYRQLWSIKNPSHPGYRIKMVRKMFPFYYRPFGMAFYLLRSFVEVTFGSKLISGMLGKKGRGFSGASQAK
jgi:GT2 family glycosyltransferase